MHESWLHFVALDLLLMDVLAKLRVAMENQTPLDYQAESGFHFGVQKLREKQRVMALTPQDFFCGTAGERNPTVVRVT